MSRGHLGAVSAAVLALAAASALVQPAVAAAATATCIPTVDVPQDGTDVSREIARQINALADGATARFATNGRYRVENPIVVKGHAGLTIDGCGSTFFKRGDGTAADGNERVWQFTDPQARLTVRNMTVDGPNDDAGPGDRFDARREGGHAYVLLGVDGALLENLSARETFGDALNVREHGATGATNRHVVVRRMTVTSAGRQGIAVTSGTDVVIEHSKLAGARLKNLDVEPEEGKVVRRVTLRHSTIGDSGSFAWGANGRDGATVDTVRVERNTFTRSMLYGFSGNPRAHLSNIVVTGNVGKAARDCIRNAKGETLCGRDVLPLRNVVGATVTNNRQPLAAGQRFLTTTGSRNVTRSGPTR